MSKMDLMIFPQNPGLFIPLAPLSKQNHHVSSYTTQKPTFSMLPSPINFLSKQLSDTFIFLSLNCHCLLHAWTNAMASLWVDVYPLHNHFKVFSAFTLDSG